MDRVVAAPDLDLDTLRQRRAELRESLSALEHALAAPAPDRAGPWAERVQVALVELSADIGAHVEVTEGVEGLHPAVLASAPRLSHAVEALSREHGEFLRLIEDLIACAAQVADEAAVEDLRHRGTALLGRLARHRQRGADLVHEAFEADVGGET
jgi:hypothetical protein